MTYEILINFQGNIYDYGTPEQARVYGDLLYNVAKYIDNMVKMLFLERKVDISEIYDLVGTSKFLTKFKENIEKVFPENNENQTIIMEDIVKNTINKYLKNSIENIKILLTSVK